MYFSYLHCVLLCQFPQCGIKAGTLFYYLLSKSCLFFCFVFLCCDISLWLVAGPDRPGADADKLLQNTPHQPDPAPHGEPNPGGLLRPQHGEPEHDARQRLSVQIKQFLIRARPSIRSLQSPRASSSTASPSRSASTKPSEIKTSTSESPDSISASLKLRRCSSVADADTSSAGTGLKSWEKRRLLSRWCGPTCPMWSGSWTT